MISEFDTNKSYVHLFGDLNDRMNASPRKHELNATAQTTSSDEFELINLFVYYLSVHKFKRSIIYCDFNCQKCLGTWNTTVRS